MTLSRRTFLKGMVATAAGLLIPAEVAAEPERRLWALDQTMLGQRPFVPELERFFKKQLEQGCRFAPHEIVWIEELQGNHATVRRGMAGSNDPVAGQQTTIEIVGPVNHLQRFDFAIVEDGALRSMGITGPNVSLGEDIATGLLKRLP